MIPKVLTAHNDQRHQGNCEGGGRKQTTHLHCHWRPIMQLCFVDLGKTGSRYRLVVEVLEHLVWSCIEIFQKKSIHLGKKNKNQAIHLPGNLTNDRI